MKKLHDFLQVIAFLFAMGVVSYYGFIRCADQAIMEQSK